MVQRATQGQSPGARTRELAKRRQGDEPMVKPMALLRDGKIEKVQAEVPSFGGVVPALEAEGIRCEILDTSAMSGTHWEEWRKRAWVIAVTKQVNVRRLFGRSPEGGSPDLGRLVAVLFLFEAREDKHGDMPG